MTIEVQEVFRNRFIVKYIHEGKEYSFQCGSEDAKNQAIEALDAVGFPALELISHSCDVHERNLK